MISYKNSWVKYVGQEKLSPGNWEGEKHRKLLILLLIQFGLNALHFLEVGSKNLIGDFFDITLQKGVGLNHSSWTLQCMVFRCREMVVEEKAHLLHSLHLMQIFMCFLLIWVVMATSCAA